MSEVKPVMSFFLLPPTQGLLLGTWGDYQRLLLSAVLPEGRQVEMVGEAPVAEGIGSA